MKILLIGHGAREHIIAERIAEDGELYAIMPKKNPAIAALSKKYWVCDVLNPTEIAKCISGIDIDVGFASPDPVLAAGISDELEKLGMLVASPTKAAARIEWDKGFARELMTRHKIGGLVDYKIANSIEEATKAINDFGDVAVKPLGLTGGKGVKVSGDHFKTSEGAVAYAKEVINKDGSVLIEEKLDGEEFTLQVFSDGVRIAPMPPVQDHKRAFINDEGVNTGGMGSYTTGEVLPFLTRKDIMEGTKILREIVHAMKKEGTPFKGILYGQFMACAKGVKIIEFNARFGDPEAINVLALLENSLVDILLSIGDGMLEPARFSNSATVVKYLVPNGYPDNPISDSKVTVDSDALEKSGARLYYASVYEKNGGIYTTKSRAFASLGIGDDVKAAEEKAEKGCGCVKGPIWHRPDIGTASLIKKRIEHMKNIRSMESL